MSEPTPEQREELEKWLFDNAYRLGEIIGQHIVDKSTLEQQIADLTEKNRKLEERLNWDDNDKTCGELSCDECNERFLEQKKRIAELKKECVTVDEANTQMGLRIAELTAQNKRYADAIRGIWYTNTVGLGLIVLGVIVGLYVGFWVCLIGGIVQVIEAVRAKDLIAFEVAVGVARIFFAGLAGYVSALLFIIPGYGMFEEN